MLIYCSVIDNPEDQDFFENLYYAYRKQMFVVARSIVNSDVSAEDVVHDVFLKLAIQQLWVVKRIDSPLGQRNYLLKATKNTALNLISKQRHEVPLDEEWAQESIHIVSDADLVDTISTRNDYATLVNAIKSMDDKYRQVLYLHFVCELSAKEIANLLNTKHETVRKRLARGKQILLQEIQCEEGRISWR